MSEQFENYQIGAVIRKKLNTAIEASGKSRASIASEMTELIGEPITENMINKYTRCAERYRFPAEYLPALCAVTGDHQLIHLMARLMGLRIVESIEAIKKEINKYQQLEEESRRKREELQMKLEREVVQ